jgi:hypothetical protein
MTDKIIDSEMDTKHMYERKRERLSRNSAIHACDYRHYRDTSIFYIIASLFYITKYTSSYKIQEYTNILFAAKHR